MRLPRMTTRRWMLAILALAVGIGFWQESRRRREQFQVEVHIWERKSLRAQIELLTADHFEPVSNPVQTDGPHQRAPEPVPPVAPVNLLQLRERVSLCQRMLRKYQFAVRYPWLPVEPDPPEPE